MLHLRRSAFTADIFIQGCCYIVANRNYAIPCLVSFIVIRQSIPTVRKGPVIHCHVIAKHKGIGYVLFYRGIITDHIGVVSVYDIGVAKCSAVFPVHGMPVTHSNRICSVYGRALTDSNSTNSVFSCNSPFANRDRRFRQITCLCVLA